MNWDAIGAIGEVLGAFCVFASLLYLAVQVRHSSRNSLSQNLNTKASQLQSFAAIQANADLMAAMKIIYTQPDRQPSFEEATLLEAYFLSSLAMAQAQYQHFVLGLDPDWDAYRRSVAALFATEFSRRWWKELGFNFFDSDFVDEVNRVIAEGYKGDLWTDYDSGT